MGQHLNNVRQLPTSLNVDDAWQAYRSLVVAMDADTSLRTDLNHCQRVARAWKRWMDVFIATDVAA